MNILRFVAAASVVSFWALGCGGTPSKMSARAQAVAKLTGDATAGQTLYSNLCLSCHGATGSGTPSGNSLAGPAKNKSVGELAEIVINGQGAMTAYGSFYTDQQIADVVAYVKATFGK